MQPAKQQGRRFPATSSARVLSIRRPLVSGFLADRIQQSHSLRASGVISSHATRALGAEVRVFRKSAGTPCTTPPAISPPRFAGRAGFLVIPSVLYKLAYFSFLVHKRIISNLRLALDSRLYLLARPARAQSPAVFRKHYMITYKLLGSEM